MSKRLVCLASIALVLSFVSTASADLVGHWTFDEGSGNLAADSSGNGNDATLEGGPTWVPGKLGGALAFDGVDDIAVVEQNSGLPIYNNGTDNAWSVAMWVKGGPQNDMRVFSEGSTTDNNPLFNLGTKNDGATGQLDVYIRPAGLGHTFSVAEPFDDTWHHIAWVDENGTARLYVDGVLDGGTFDYTRATLALDTTTIGGILRAAPSHFFTGQIDDVQIYNHALADVEILGVMSGAGAEYPLASGPTPVDGAMLEATWVNLGWRAGDFAVSHDVYLGDNFDDVDNGTGDTFRDNLPLATTSLIAGFIGMPIPDGLLPGTTYYWRVDEVNETEPNSPWIGNVWSFTVPPKTAYNPVPTDATTFVATAPELSWTAGFGAQLHTVYFGDDFDTVSNASGGQLITELTFNTGPLEKDKTYYWRVDAFEAPITHKGDVWSFMTLPDIPVSGEQNLMLWWTLDEGQSAAGPVDWSGHDQHATVAGDPQWIADGYQRSALQFDDSGDYLYKTLAPAMPSQSVCAWARIDKAPASILGWSNAHPTSGTHDRELYVSADGRANWRIWTDATNTVTSLGSIADGRWHHLAGVYTDEGTTELYLDGVLQGSNAASGIYNAYSNPFLTVGIDSQQNRYLTGAVDDLRVFDKALTAEEIAAVMLGDTKLAGNPVPDRNAAVDIRDISSLSWSAGDGAASHDVYFGTDKDALESKGNQAGTSLSLADLVEFGGGDYYWRIDEVAADGTVTAGTMWKFTVPDYLIVEDFESYNDLAEDDPASNRIYLTWIDGFGTTTNGAVAGNLDVPLMAPGRESSQAMPLGYDNAGKTSEATKTLTSGKDWTVQGVTKLVVWFSGDAANAADRMFVALGNAVVYHPDDAATQDTGWNEWVIDLQELANQGANLANVGSITLGFGTRNAPVATGGTGTVEFDDIGLIQ